MIKKNGETALVLPVSYDRMHLTINKKLKFEEAMQLSNILERITESHQWYWGDFLNYAEATYGEEFAQLVPDSVDSSLLLRWRWVAERFAPNERDPKLSWSHHEVLAGIEDKKERMRILKEVSKKNLTVTKTRALVKGKKPSSRKVFKCPSCGYVGEMEKPDEIGKELTNG